MGKPITTKDCGIDEITGLQKNIEVFHLDINSDSEVVNVEYREIYMSPTNVEVKRVSSGYTRFNKPAENYQNGEIITPAVKDEDGIVTTPAEVSDGTQVKIKASMKFDDLRNSDVGKMIIGMIDLDFKVYPNLAQ